MDQPSFPRFTFCMLFGLSLVAANAGAAPPDGHGKPDQSAAHDVALVEVDLDVAQARQLAVSHHYTGYRALPPGIRKNLARGKPLPPGIAKKVVKAPMLERLPAYPGYEWRRYGTDLVLVQVATQIVAEVLANIFQ